MALEKYDATAVASEVKIIVQELRAPTHRMLDLLPTGWNTSEQDRGWLTDRRLEVALRRLHALLNGGDIEMLDAAEPERRLARVLSMLLSTTKAVLAKVANDSANRCGDFSQPPLDIAAINDAYNLLSNWWDTLISEHSGKAREAEAGSLNSNEMTRLWEWCQHSPQLGVREPAIPMSPPARADSADSPENLFPKGIPNDTEVVDVVLRLKQADLTAETKLNVARKYTKEAPGNDPIAKRILNRIRVGIRRGKIKL